MTTISNLIVNGEIRLESPSYKGTGLNDLSVRGAHSSNAEVALRLKLSEANPAGADKVTPYVNGVAGIEVAITGGWQALDGGVEFKFGSVRGHTLNDFWDLRAFPSSALDVKDSSGNSVFAIAEDGVADLNVNLDMTGKDLTMDDLTADVVNGASAIFSGDVAAATLTAPILKSAATGGADDILIKPAGVTALTVAEGGDVTVVGDVIVSGGDVTALNIKSAATGGADDITISPAGTLALTIAEGGNVTAVGALAASNFSGSHSGTSSGTNTGDQTITLTGAVTGSGTGSFATTLATAQSSTTSLSFTIDSDNNSSAETFTVKCDAGTTLLTVDEAGYTTSVSGFRSTNGNYDSTQAYHLYYAENHAYPIAALAYNAGLNSVGLHLCNGTAGRVGTAAAELKLLVSQTNTSIADGTELASFKAATGMKLSNIVTSLPTADATNVGSIVVYETGSGGTLARTPVTSVCAAGAYKWVYLTTGTNV